MMELEELFDSLESESSTAAGADAVLAGAVAANRRRVVARAVTTVAAIVLLGGVLFAALDQPDDRSVVSDDPDTVTSTTVAVDPAATLDWEPGLRWDYGQALGLDAGETEISFNRVSVMWNAELEGMPATEPPTRACPSADPAVPYVTCDDGVPVVSGTEWTAEYLVFGNTDTANIDLATTPRSYRLADDVEILHLANARSLCPGQPEPYPQLDWEPLSLDQLATLLADPDVTTGQDSLTFDDAGRVTRIRLATGC